MPEQARAKAFGARVRRTRESLGISQNAASRRAGLSPSGWRNIEQATNVGLPERTSVLQIARVLGWDPDEALASLGLEPATDLEKSLSPVDPRDELDRLWDSLATPQRWALVYTAATMVAPRQWPEYELLARPDASAGERVVVQPIVSGAGTIPHPPRKDPKRTT